ncbi:MAG: hypothetical protein LDL53_11450 [Candidatus Hydrogenedens sp.]|nr:hypothetical protein [Candidatus Hydrogenedens sp.]
MKRRDFLRIQSAGVLSLFSWSLARQVSADVYLRVASFKCDATPPLGTPWYPSYKPLDTIEHPLLAKGLIIETDKQRYVLCAIDWCEIANRSYYQLCEMIATAVKTEPNAVFVHTVHQHTAPMCDADAFDIIGTIQNPPPCPKNEVFDEIYRRIVQSIESALPQLMPCTSIEIGKAKVERVASNRRVVMPDGTIATRSSSCKDPKLIEAEEGLIDPYVRTLSFVSKAGRPIVRLHYYATHPQSFYWDPRASYDFPGMAREEMEKEEGVPHIYFTGCGGDIAGGKYNDGSPEARQQLYQRMLEGMQKSVQSSQKDIITEPQFKVTSVYFEPANDKHHSKENLEKIMNDTNQKHHVRIDSAMELAWQNRTGQPIPIAGLHFGNVSILSLPGEPMVEFQLYAQQCAPHRHVFVAGYGDCAPAYICTERSFKEGGYEPYASHVVPASETKLKSAIKEVLL